MKYCLRLHLSTLLQTTRPPRLIVSHTNEQQTNAKRTINKAKNRAKEKILTLIVVLL